MFAPGADRRADELDEDAKVVGLGVKEVQHVPQPLIPAPLEEGRKGAGNVAFRKAAADVTMNFLDHRRPHCAQPRPPVGSRARACQAVVRLVLQHGLYVAQAVLLVPDDVGFIDCRVASILRATADGNDTRFHRRTFLSRVPPAPLAREGILQRPEACAAQHHAVALPQGWMVLLLNLSRFDGIVSIRILG